MPKNIVICSDGTGNTAGKVNGTNVFKLFEAVDLNSFDHTPDLIRQIAIYDDGVGTERLKPLKLLSGALGLGLSHNVRELYASLVRVYEPGDRIYLFGFSRGAFTVRTLAGMITTCGVLDRQMFTSDAALRRTVFHCYRSYRCKYRPALWAHFLSSDPGERLARLRKDRIVVHPTYAPHGQVPIEFIGVWDTVDAVGLPSDYLADLINNTLYRFKFPDHQLSPLVKRACHALAVDEERQSFKPLLWNESGERGQRVTQVWFPGVHSNVGGGYPKEGLALVTLDWMMRQAEDVGLRFVKSRRQEIRECKNANDKLYDSRSGLGCYYRYQPRDIDSLCSAAHTVPKLHISVIDRMLQGTEGYAPGNIPLHAQWISPELDTSMSTAIADALRDGSSTGKVSFQELRSRNRRFMAIRHYAHFGFVITTLLTLYLTVIERLPTMDVASALLGLPSPAGFMDILSTVTHNAWLLILLLAFYGSSWAAKYIMDTNSSEFWYAQIPKLKAACARPSPVSVRPARASVLQLFRSLI